MNKVIRIFLTPKHVFFCIFFLYFVGFLAHALYLKKSVYGDGIYYYSWLRSAVIDCNMDFSNEYSFFKGSQPFTSLGLTGNKYSIGPAALWLPAYVAVHAVIQGTGYELPYQFAVGLTSVFYAVTGLLLLYRILLCFVSEKCALLTILSVACATHLLFYGSLDTVNSHALSFFSVTLFLLLLWVRPVHWFILGLSLSLVTLIRLQDSVIGLLLIAPIPLFRKSASTIVSFLSGFLPVIFFQFILWKILYGTWIFSPYVTGDEGFTILHPRIFYVLFNVQNGLFLYTPMLVLSLLGFFIPWKRVVFPKRILAVILILQVFIVSSWSSPGQGASYSGRMFVSMLPVFAVPLAFFYAKILRIINPLLILMSSIVPLSFINCVLIVYTLLRQ